MEKRIGFWRWLGREIKNAILIFTLIDLKKLYSLLKEGMWLIEFVIGIILMSGGIAAFTVFGLKQGRMFHVLLYVIITITGFLVLMHGDYLMEGDC